MKLNELLSPEFELTSVVSTRKIPESKDLLQSTYYLTKNKWSTQTRNNTPVPTHTTHVLQHSSQNESQLQAENSTSALEEMNILQLKSTTFKKRLVSQAQGRSHANTIKKINMIQRQIQANTRMTKNRLANSNFEGAPSVPAHFTPNTCMNRSSTGEANSRNHTYSTQVADISTKRSTKLNLSVEGHEPPAQPNKFQPLLLKQSGVTSQKLTTRQAEEESKKRTFDGAASKFLEIRRRVAASQLSRTGKLFYEQETKEALTEQHHMFRSDFLVAEDPPKSSAPELSEQKRLLERTMQQGFHIEGSHTVKCSPRGSLRQTSLQRLLQEHDSYLDSNVEILNAGCASPANRPNASQMQSLFAPTELDGKRLGNNISEIQISLLTEDSRSHFKTQQANDASVLFSQVSKLAVTNKLPLQDCTRCKLWRRINHECRNYSARANYQDFKSVVKFIEELAGIDSIQKVTPELSRALTTLKDSFKGHYEAEVGGLRARNFQLEKKVEDMVNLAKVYKSELGKVQAQLQQLNAWITDCQWTTLRGDAAHQALIQNEVTRLEDIEDAQAFRNRLEYSDCKADLIDLKKAVGMTRSHQEQTLAMMTFKIKSNVHQAILHINEIFEREDRLQEEAAREFMKNHFRVQIVQEPTTREKATCTVENMISKRLGGASRVEIAQLDQLQNVKQQTTDLKVENCLLFQRTVYLDQEILELKQYQQDLLAKLAFFKGLDLDKMRREMSQVQQLRESNEQLASSLQKAETKKHELIKENKRLGKQSDYYEEEVKTSMAFYFDALDQLAKLRRDLQSVGTEGANLALDNQIASLKSSVIDMKVQGVSGAQKAVNPIKGHMNELRSKVVDSIDILNRIVELCQTENRPLLASKQILEVVFQSYRERAQSEAKAKYEDMLSDMRAKLMGESEAAPSEALKESLRSFVKRPSVSRNPAQLPGSMSVETGKVPICDASQATQSEGQGLKAEAELERTVSNLEDKQPETDYPATPALLPGPRPRLVSKNPTSSTSVSKSPRNQKKGTSSSVVSSKPAVQKSTPKVAKQNKGKQQQKFRQQSTAIVSDQGRKFVAPNSKRKLDQKESEVVPLLPTNLVLQRAPTPQSPRGAISEIDEEKSDGASQRSIEDQMESTARLVDDTPPATQASALNAERRSIMIQRLDHSLGSQTEVEDAEMPTESVQNTSREKLAGASEVNTDINVEAPSNAHPRFSPEYQQAVEITRRVGSADDNQVQQPIERDVTVTSSTVSAEDAQVQRSVKISEQRENGQSQEKQGVLEEGVTAQKALESLSTIQRQLDHGFQNEEMAARELERIEQIFAHIRRTPKAQDTGPIVIDRPNDHEVRMRKLKHLMSEFLAKPTDEAIKDEYFKALRQEYREQSSRGIHPLMSREPTGLSKSSAVKKVSSQTPSRQFPLSRPQLNLNNTAAAFAAQSPSPPKFAQQSHQSHQARFNAHEIAVLGEATLKKRQHANIATNSKDTQCDLLNVPLKVWHNQSTQADLQVKGRKDKAAKSGPNSKAAQMLKHGKSTEDMELQVPTSGPLLPSRMFEPKPSQKSPMKDQSLANGLEAGIWVQTQAFDSRKQSTFPTTSLRSGGHSPSPIDVHSGQINEPNQEATAEDDKSQKRAKVRQRKSGKDRVMLEIKRMRFESRHQEHSTSPDKGNDK